MNAIMSLVGRMLLAGGVASWGVVVIAADFSPEDLEFFERQIRPVLVDHCQKCHGPAMQKGGLRLDSRAAALKGGDTGPAISAGDAKQSLLVQALHYDADSYQMPPAGKLPGESIAAVERWIERGAAWPADAPSTLAVNPAEDWSRRAGQWSLQPVTPRPAPSLDARTSARNVVDAWIEAGLRDANVLASPEADRRTLVRRVSFELTGLPPKPELIDRCIQSTDPLWYERLVDELLASPHFGVRWGRHWLDLVRFAETRGHEFDYEIPAAWPYRDYVVRAFNDDVPYREFVREQIAGDLIPNPRRNASGPLNESVVGTAFWWFSQGKHSPVDIRAEECDLIDNQLDVFGKTFLGMTIACARCHDHKFDAIEQRDYHALAGYLQSSRMAWVDRNDGPEARRHVESLREFDRNQSPLAARSSAAKLLAMLPAFEQALANVAVSGGLDEATRTAARARWKEQAKAIDHPLHAWAALLDGADAADVRRRIAQLAGRLEAAIPASATDVVWPPVRLEDWRPSGFAWTVPSAAPPVLSLDAAKPVARLALPRVADSGTSSPALQGALRSPTFPITKRYLDFLTRRVGGPDHPGKPLKNGQIHVVVDGFQMIKDPLYGQLSLNVPNNGEWTWRRQDLAKFQGTNAFIELDDFDDSTLQVASITATDGPPPSRLPNGAVVAAFVEARVDSVPAAAQRLAALCRETLATWSTDPNTTIDADRAALINALISAIGDLPSAPAAATESSDAALNSAVADMMQRRAALVRNLPTPAIALGTVDGTAEDDRLLIRGNPRKPGETIPRRFLKVLGGAGPDSGETGSGRLALADKLVDGSNPLLARVYVNRLWQHVFGTGLVPTSDDFGHMGQPPSHPELLDQLADRFMRTGWSTKSLLRELMTSAAYRRTSRAADPEAEGRDPLNRLRHRQNVQRLEAEAIRDAMLFVSGRLNDAQGGPGVLPHLSAFMEGRGRPGSGPVDGDGRRSIYLNVRRNFLPSLFLAFDFPTPFTTTGRRSVSNVPAQALTLMNNPFVIEQAGRWVQSLPNEPPARRIERMFRSALGRDPLDDERADSLAFIAAQTEEHRGDPARAWQDFAQVLWNSKEFIYIE